MTYKNATVIVDIEGIDQDDLLHLLSVVEKECAEMHIQSSYFITNATNRTDMVMDHLKERVNRPTDAPNVDITADDDY